MKGAIFLRGWGVVFFNNKQKTGNYSQAFVNTLSALVKDKYLSGSNVTGKMIAEIVIIWT